MKPSLVIIGLGNPGKDYDGTRHNVGFMAVDVLAEEFGEGDWQPKQKFTADVMEGRIVTVPILLVKPTTYMNRSGECAKKIVDFFKLDPANQLLVICDDIDQPVGESKLLESGGPGTHNGLRSLHDQFGEAFPRLRIGIRGSDAPEGSFQKAGEDLSRYVLSRPGKEEAASLDSVIESCAGDIQTFVMS